MKLNRLIASGVFMCAVATVLALGSEAAQAQVSLPAWAAPRSTPSVKPAVVRSKKIVKKLVKSKPAPLPYTELIINNDPIVLTGNQILEIKKVHYISTNSITLKDNAQLIIRDSFFEQRNASSSLAMLLKASGAAHVTITNSALEFGHGINWNFSNHAVLSIDNANVPTSGLLTPAWHEFSDFAQATVRRAVFHGSVSDQANITIDQSPDVYLSLNVPSGAVMDEEFPHKVNNFVFPGFNDRNMYFKLKITNSTASLWGLTLNPESTITIKNTGAVNLALILARPLVNATTTLDDLNPTAYKDRTIAYGNDAQKMFRLRLINTSVTSWEPIVGNDNTVTIKNSEITEQRWHWGNAKITLDHTTAFLVRAQNDVTITAQNSKITSDAVAKDNGKVILINSKVLGQKITEGNGQIIEQK